VIQIEEVLETNFINFSNDRLSNHSATVTDTIDSSSIVLALDSTEQDDISFTK
jgi:hypothetical protein